VRVTIAKTVPPAFTCHAGMDISRDNGLVVDRDEDRAPYAFTGIVKEAVFDLQPVHEEAEKALHEHASIHAVGRGGLITDRLGCLVGCPADPSDRRGFPAGSGPGPGDGS
jgi:hypothetical protein